MAHGAVLLLAFGARGLRGYRGLCRGAKLGAGDRIGAGEEAARRVLQLDAERIAPEFWRGWAKRLFFPRCDLIFCYGKRAQAMATHSGARPEALVRRCQAAALPPGYDARAVPAMCAIRASPKPASSMSGVSPKRRTLLG